MCCAGGEVLSKNLALCCAVSIDTSRQLIIPNIENNPEGLGFWCVAKERYFLTFFKEDYYV
jgi:hypothetical protein